MPSDVTAQSEVIETYVLHLTQTLVARNGDVEMGGRAQV